ncbi:hypothetical protein E4T39_00819 [Aureobasidium subglaciale]|nr:hypothetical protein E4T39_00819 [Aureobasidium subglaciale]
MSSNAGHSQEASHFDSRLSSHAAKDGKAKIISRSSPSQGLVTYTLEIGTAIIPQFSLAEVEEYVSAYDLEVFENQTFERENAEQELQQKVRLAAKAQARRLKGTATYSDSSSNTSARDESLSGASPSGGDDARAAVRGRQRPTYTHFYPRQRAPRGSLKAASSARVTLSNKTADSGLNGSNNRDIKRRRLVGDRDGSISSSKDTESVYSIGSPKRLTQPPSAMEQAAGLIPDAHEESDNMDLDDESDHDMEIPIRQPTRSMSAKVEDKTKGKGAASRFFTFRDHAVPSATSGIRPKSSQSQPTKTGFTTSSPGAQLSAALAKAAALKSASSKPLQASQTTKQNISTLNRQAVINMDDSSSSDSDSDSDSGSEDSEVYSVEKILSHNLSDPKSHDRSVHGEKPVMLYQVKWEGYDETTWEPETSFEDKDVLQEYWAQQEQKRKQKQKQK